MANSFNKRELEKKREKKRKDKQQRKEERKEAGVSSFDDMIAYVDENGAITDTPPNPTQKREWELESIVIATPKKEDVEKSDLRGMVEYFNTEKGYGFIKNISNKEKYFFHVSNAPQGITEGNAVTFELERGGKGMNAIKITIVKQ